MIRWGSRNMSEAWHQHLQNLTWWEQIDRFFNPGKYSCTIPIINDTVWHLYLLGIFLSCTISIIVLLWLMRKQTVTQQEEKKPE